MSAERPPGPQDPPRSERLTRDHRLTTSKHYAEVKQRGAALRGRCCLLLVLPQPGEPTRIGFIASKRGVGGSVSRNRAKRRLREIVRRRWPRIPEHGFWIAVIASRGALSAPHAELASELERLLAAAGALGAVGAIETGDRTSPAPA